MLTKEKNKCCQCTLVIKTKYALNNNNMSIYRFKKRNV